MHIALREGNRDAGFVQSIVYHFFRPLNVRYTFRHEHHLKQEAQYKCQNICSQFLGHSHSCTDQIQFNSRHKVTKKI